METATRRVKFSPRHSETKEMAQVRMKQNEQSMYLKIGPYLGAIAGESSFDDSSFHSRGINRVHWIRWDGQKYLFNRKKRGDDWQGTEETGVIFLNSYYFQLISDRWSLFSHSSESNEFHRDLHCFPLHNPYRISSIKKGIHSSFIRSTTSCTRWLWCEDLQTIHCLRGQITIFFFHHSTNPMHYYENKELAWISTQCVIAWFPLYPYCPIHTEYSVGNRWIDREK